MLETTATASTLIHASRRAIWQTLTDPELVREYFMGATISTDWNVGSPITFSGEWNGNAYEDKGEILIAEPEERLRFSHWSPLAGTEDVPENYHVVDIELSNENGQTKVTLTQSNLMGGITEADRANREHYEKNWSMVLTGLKQIAER